MSSVSSSSVAAHEAPTNSAEQTKATQTGFFFANNIKGTTLDSLSRHVALLPKQLAIAIKKQASSMLSLVLEIAH